MTTSHDSTWAVEEDQPWVRETTDTLAASRVLRDLAAAKDLYARLRLLDEVVAKLPAERQGVVLKGLLESQLPGDFYDAENLRLAVMARLGDTPGWDSGQVLTARLAPDRPRPERLLAIELLAGRPEVGTPELEAIVRDDHDGVVQSRARWALGKR